MKRIQRIILCLMMVMVIITPVTQAYTRDWRAYRDYQSTNSTPELSYRSYSSNTDTDRIRFYRDSGSQNLDRYRRLTDYTSRYQRYDWNQQENSNTDYRWYRDWDNTGSETPQTGVEEPDQGSSGDSRPGTGAETGSSVASSEEMQMLALINEERAKAGLAPLEMDPELVRLARLKSKDMIENDYFSHTSPTYGSPFEMLRNAGVNYRTAGENIAGNWSVEAAHQALMNSEGHRRNILNPSYKRIGIGIVDGGRWGKIFTQLFVG